MPQAVDVLLLQIQITGIVNMYRVASLNYTSLGQELASLSHWTGAGRPLSLDRGWPASLIGQGLAGLSHWTGAGRPLSLDRGWPASLIGQELAGLSHWTGAGQPLIGQGLAGLSLDRGWLASHWTGAGLSC